MWTARTIAMRFLLQGRTQSLLILVAVGIGVAVTVFITALIAGLQANLIGRTLGTQAHVRVLPPEEVNLPAPASPDALQLRLEDRRAQRLRSINNWQDVRDGLEALPGIVAVSPEASGPAFLRRGDAIESVVVMGISPDRYRRIIPVERYLVGGEFRVGANDAVIGSELARDLGARVGGKVRIDTGLGDETVLNVAGIFRLGVRELDTRYVYLDLKLAQSLLGQPGAATVIELRVRDLFAADAVARRIARLTGLKAEGWMQNNAQLMNALQSQTLSTRIVIVFVSLSVAFGIASVLAISVTQRRREIGILRAMGTTRRQMVGVFLIQGTVLGLAGSLAGNLLGYGLVQAFNRLGPGLFSADFGPGLVAASMLLATLTGTAAASLPAWRAARLDPAEAIRNA